MPACAQGFHLFSGAAEDQRVATLEANHLQAQQRVLNHQRIESRLADALLSETLAHVLDFGRGWNEREDFRR